MSPVVQDLTPKSRSAEGFVYICYIFYRAKQLACTSPGGDADIYKCNLLCKLTPVNIQTVSLDSFILKFLY